MNEMETGAWRGVIIDGELVEPHDDSYDDERDYSDIEDAKAEGDEDDAAEDRDDEDAEGDEEEVSRPRRHQGARRRTPAPA
jgi:hypothetical protein